jgi:hypothetical protein
LLAVGSAAAVPKAIAVNAGDRASVMNLIMTAMQGQGYKLTSSDSYQLTFEKRLRTFYEGVTYMDPFVFKNAMLRKVWSLVPSPRGLEAVVDIFVVSSHGTRLEKVYDTADISSFSDPEAFEREKLYDLFDLKASVEGLDRYFIMRASGLFPELKPVVPKADMLMEGNRIIAVLPDGVAGKMGLKAGDYIIEVNGNLAEGDIVGLIDSRLALGNRVMLLVQRNGVREITTLSGDDYY